MRKIKVVVLLVQQLQHGFTKNAKVSPNLTVAHILHHNTHKQKPVGLCHVNTNHVVYMHPLCILKLHIGQ